MKKRNKIEEPEIGDTQMVEVTLTPLESQVIELKKQGLKYHEIAKAMPSVRGRKKSRQAVYDMLRRAQRKLWRLDAPNRYTINPGDCPIAETPLTARIRSALKEAGYERIGQLAGMSREDLEAITGMGRHGSFQTYGYIQSLGIKTKPHSFCPSCGTALERKLGGKRPLSCDNCGSKTTVKVIEEPQAIAVG